MPASAALKTPTDSASADDHDVRAATMTDDDTSHDVM